MSGDTTPNAIQRLRDFAILADPYVTTCDCEDCAPVADALAAVETLYQAAKPLDGYANDESGPYVLVRLDELRALAAAVRQVNGLELAECICPTDNCPVHP